MQVVETSLTSGIISGVTRLACEIGTPNKIYIDQDNADMCALDCVEFATRDLQLKLERHHAIDFGLCPVSGHNAHRHVERTTS